MEQRAVVTHGSPAGSPPRAPYFRRPGEGTTPDGWVAEPVRGAWQGQQVEVVYDAQRYEVAFLWHGHRNRRNAGIDVIYEHHDQDVTLISSDDAETSERALEVLGWKQCAIDGQRSFWTRDRHAATRAALKRIDQAVASTELNGPSRHPRQLQAGPELTL